MLVVVIMVGLVLMELVVMNNAVGVAVVIAVQVFDSSLY